MNREDKGKALHICVSQGLPADQAWDSMTEETRELYRAVGESIAQDFMYGGKYELSLSPLDDDQILYNGLFTCMLPRDRSGSCHLLLLRSKNRDVENEEAIQKMAIIAQTPGRFFLVQRQIEHIATLVTHSPSLKGRGFFHSSVVASQSIWSVAPTRRTCVVG